MTGSHDESSATRSSPGPQKRGALAYAALVLLLPFVALALSQCGDDVQGTLTVTRPQGDRYTHELVRCGSLSPLGRTGVRLMPEARRGGGLYVIADAVEGASVHVVQPGSCRDAAGTGCAVTHVPRDRCDEHEVVIEPNGDVYNTVPMQRGSAHLRCTLEDATRIEASLHFDGC